MHNLIALSLGLPGTPLHGLNDFDPRTRSTSLAPAHGARGAARPDAAASPRQPQAARRRRFAARHRRPVAS